MGEVEEYMDKSRERLISSKLLFETGHYEVSVSASYYAIFLAAKALLVSRGFETKKHSGVISIFGKEFVNEGDFDSKLFNHLTVVQSLREDSDYESISYITDEIAEEQILNAEEFISEVEKFL